LGRDRRLFVALGQLSIVIGLLAISSRFTVFTTWAMVAFFGVLLLVAGITEVVQAVMVRNWGFALPLLAAGLLRAIYSLVERSHGWSWVALRLAVRVCAAGTDRLAMLDV
jgi:uncharacterized membrane protein HdeD (DUF308 family)